MHIGNYIAIKKIGEGSHSLVYKAKKLNSDEVVAIKILNKKENQYTDIKKESQIYDLIREKAISGVTPCLDKDKENKIPEFFVMPLRKCSLEEIIWELAIEDKMRYTASILETLKNLHFYNIIHRDLKPSNLLITDDERIEITDFGIGKQENNFDPDKTISQDSKYTGTENYFAPEQLSGNGKNISQKQSDVFSISMCIYRIFADGKRLFVDYKNKNIVGFESLNDKYDIDIDKFIKKGIEWDFESRYKDAGEMYDEFQSLIYSASTIKEPVNNESDSENIFYKSETFLKLENYDSAIESLEEIIGSHDEEEILIKSYFLIGNAYYKKRNELIENFNEDGWEVVAEIEKPLFEDYEVVIKNFLFKAEKSFQEVLKINPGHINSYLNLGSCYVELGKFNKASECFKNVIKLDSKENRAYYELSKLNYSYENFDKSLNYLKKIDENQIKLNFEYCVLYGDIFDKLKKHEEAIKYYDNAININDNVGYVHRYKAVSFLKLADQLEDKNFEKDIVKKLRLESVKNYYQAIKVDPDQQIAYRMLGWVLEDLELYEEAIKILEKCIELYPHYKQAYSTLMIAYKNNDQKEKSLEFFKEKIFPMIDKNFHSPLYSAALSNLNLERFDEAIEMSKLKLKYDPKHYKSYRTLARAYFMLGDHEKALKNIKISIKLNPKNKFNRHTLVKILRLTESYDEARKEADNALKLFPEYATLLEETAEIYADQEDFEKAILFLDKSIQSDPLRKGPRKLKISILKKLGLESEVRDELIKFTNLDIEDSIENAYLDEEIDEIEKEYDQHEESNEIQKNRIHKLINDL